MLITIQGLQLLVDTYDGFGGLAASLLDELADDFGNKGIFTMAVAPPHYPNSVSLNLRKCSSSGKNTLINCVQIQIRHGQWALAFRQTLPWYKSS